MILSGFIGYIITAKSTHIKPRNIELEDVLAYSKQRSFYIGDTIRFCVHTIENATCVLYRLGEKKEKTTIQFSIPSLKQSNAYHPKTGFSWHENVRFSSSGIHAGMYVAEIKTKQGKGFAIPFFLSDTVHHDTYVIVNTYNWQTYNSFAGISNYVDKVTPHLLRKLYAYNWLEKPLIYLPYYRPNIGLSKELLDKKNINETIDKKNLGSRSALALWSFLAFLEKNKINYNLISDDDFTTNNFVEKSRLIFFVNHAEYWTNEMLGKLKYVQDRNVNTVFYCGNTAYRTIQKYEQNTIRVTVQENNKRDITPFIGTFYNEANYYYYSPYKCLKPEHWVFQHCNLKKNQRFGTYYSSGFETDQLNQYSTGFELLAIGENEFSPAHFVIKEDNKKFIINASSILSAKSVIHDSTFSTITLNIIQHALQQK